MEYIHVPNSVAVRLPGWLHDVFITEVLSKHYTNPKVIDFVIVPLSKSYSVFRAHFNFNADEFEGNKESSFIVKKQLKSQQLRKTAYDFSTEINIYKDVIPIFYETLREMGDNTVFAPRCLYYQYRPRQVIVLEDLKASGYENTENRMLKMDEMAAALKKIAKWHAVSYKLAKESPSLFKEYCYGLLVEQNTFQMALMMSGFETFLELLKCSPRLEIFLPFFEKLRLNYGAELKKPFEEYEEDRQPDVFYALNHGDFHSRNMMFKRNKITNNIEDVKFIDFQISYMGPIATDVMCSMYQLLTCNERLNYRDEWIYVHFNEFQEMLKTIAVNDPKPKLTEFRDQIMRYKCFEFFLIYTFLPIWYAQDKGERTQLLLNTVLGHFKLFTDLDYIDELLALLPLHLTLGYFD